MFDKKKIKELVLVSLVADAYCLGAHWVYDEKQLEELDINWEELNNAKSVWHKGKLAGEFTHYGDQLLWLYQFIQNKDSFEIDEYIKYWKTKVDIYNGYIDSATRKTVENIENNIIPTGSESTDLSVVGRITPLLLVSNTKEEFLKNVEDFVKATHNSLEAINTSKYFAKLLLEVLDGKGIEESILLLKEQFNTKIQAYIYSGIASKTDDTFKSIRDFGPACDIEGGFQGVIHLLCKYTNLKEMLIANAKAGGDSSSRAMIASVIFMAQKNKTLASIPSSWLNIKATII
ncbi:ADP-ribosylglycohydrolase family protein [Halarcobacter sp.]|uniref:ADP-ribosylglycohydrolase family protein n=1 Tax=Halarcobacter sp. TaxID=2321133 RepID=UPI002AAC0376|nr:ADP-ribosylglycohydrolase family protein [Halarcobacter sp.]